MMRGAQGSALKGDPTLETGFMRLARGMDRRWREPSPEARYSYWLGFGVLPDEQVAMEGWYRAVQLEYHPAQPEGASEVIYPPPL